MNQPMWEDLSKYSVEPHIKEPSLYNADTIGLLFM